MATEQFVEPDGIMERRLGSERLMKLFRSRTNAGAAFKRLLEVVMLNLHIY